MQSSKAGECFQIWIDPPGEGQICVHAAGIEGRKENDAPEDWCVSISDLEAALEYVFADRYMLDGASECFLPK